MRGNARGSGSETHRVIVPRALSRKRQGVMAGNDAPPTRAGNCLSWRARAPRAHHGEHNFLSCIPGAGIYKSLTYPLLPVITSKADPATMDPTAERTSHETGAAQGEQSVLDPERA